MNRDPSSPNPIYMPETLREAAQRLEYSEHPRAGEITHRMARGFELLQSDIFDLIDRHYQTHDTLEKTLKTVLCLKPEQTMQYDSDHVLVLTGIPLTGEALESAKDMVRLRYALQMLVAIQNRVQTQIKIELKKAHVLLEAAALEAGVDPNKHAILGEHLVYFDPAEPPLSARKDGASA